MSAEQKSSVQEEIRALGGLRQGTARVVARKTGVPEAQVYGVGSFYHLLAEPEVDLRVCTGLSCRLAGAEDLLRNAQEQGLRVAGCSCLAACDRAPAQMKDRQVFWPPEAGGDLPGRVGPDGDPDTLALNLTAACRQEAPALALVQEKGPDWLFQELQQSGLQGRGGAGFPAHLKWRGVAEQKDPVRYVVLNADEGEPGTFKDREVLMRRPDLVLEGLAIAATALKAKEIYMYLRGEFLAPWQALQTALDQATSANLFPGLNFHLHAGHGAYICGEETALLEALEGKRGMPRLKPPFPVENGLWGHPTLIHNVETIACVPSIVEKGGEWFRALGKTGPGTKLYNISGHVDKPGTYEMPLGISLGQLLEVAGGMIGKLKAFSPGGASSGFLPASMADLPLDFQALQKAGSMLGSAGVVVLNETVSMPSAVECQLSFFEEESCGQCAPCRIGTRFLRECLQRFLRDRKNPQALAKVADAAWQMNEGSICGLGQAAPLPLTTALQHFPEEFQP
ncbi:MAG: NADH-quinone oxidoreductase subunit F [Planctomycetota bacterium]|nr:MAG: NADH-quinone oxidoreductase subunit F [Planctomycetota bacterium]